MPITISITTETAQQAREEMRSLLGQDRETAAPAEQEAQPEKPKATRSTKAKPSPDATTADAPSKTEEEPTTGEETSTPSADTATTSPSEPVTEANLRERATKFAAKAGPPALIEMQKLAGAPNGRISEVVADQAAMTKLDALLADAGF